MHAPSAQLPLALLPHPVPLPANPDPDPCTHIATRHHTPRNLSPSPIASYPPPSRPISTPQGYTVSYNTTPTPPYSVPSSSTQKNSTLNPHSNIQQCPAHCRCDFQGSHDPAIAFSERSQRIHTFLLQSAYMTSSA
jgi:hypothetical protein